MVQYLVTTGEMPKILYLVSLLLYRVFGDASADRDPTIDRLLITDTAQPEKNHINAK